MDTRGVAFRIRLWIEKVIAFEASLEITLGWMMDRKWMEVPQLAQTWHDAWKLGRAIARSMVSMEGYVHSIRITDSSILRCTGVFIVE